VSVAVAHMALGAWPEDALVPYLAPSEQARFSSLSNTRRRHEYAGARVLAKYLFLNRSRDAMTMVDVRPEDITLFSTSTFREIEVARGDGPPQLIWRDAPQRNIHLSLAHGSGYVAAAISAQGPVGLDVMDIAVRAPSFYRKQFSPREQAWANDDASYALLWALKESVVKTGAVPDATLWGFDEIEILVEQSAGDVARHHSHSLLPLTVRVPRAASAIADAGFARVRNLLLSFVTLETVRDAAGISGGVNAWQHRHE